jgi:hypothetical protein
MISLIAPYNKSYFPIEGVTKASMFLQGCFIDDHYHT